MQPRLKFNEASAGAYKAMLALETYVQNCGLEKATWELVKLRASQINGCAYCLDMHSKDARAAGETEQRLYCLSTWRECPFYTDRERAALEWTEALTLISKDHVPDPVYEAVKPHFTEKELVDLTMAVIAINGWNRIAIPFRFVPGSYKPAKHT